MTLIDALNRTGKWWMIGKGMSKPGEPLWGCVIQEPEIDGMTLARVEGNDLGKCVSAAIAELRDGPVFRETTDLKFYRDGKVIRDDA